MSPSLFIIFSLQDLPQIVVSIPTSDINILNKALFSLSISGIVGSVVLNAPSATPDFHNQTKLSDIRSQRRFLLISAIINLLFFSFSSAGMSSYICVIISLRFSSSYCVKSSLYCSIIALCSSITSSIFSVLRYLSTAAGMPPIIIQILNISIILLWIISSTFVLVKKQFRRLFIIVSSTLNICKNSSKSIGYIFRVCKYPTGADLRLTISTPSNEPDKIYLYLLSSTRNLILVTISLYLCISSKKKIVFPGIIFFSLNNESFNIRSSMLVEFFKTSTSSG